MSTTVDERIVSLKFDNAQFEKNAKKSMKTLDDLDSSLNTSSSTKLQNGIEGTTKSMVSMVAEATIVNKVVGTLTDKVLSFAGSFSQFTRSLSIGQISAGWNKFSQETVSVGTLMAQNLKAYNEQLDAYVGFDNQDDKMAFITEQLDKLAWYTDETSYKFEDMVDTIGKFTAAGQEFEPAMEAVMGIANWAAKSGQNAETASRAMYQLSQAIGAGVVKREDYKSIQNANMDTDEFRQTVLDTAVAMGQLSVNSRGVYTTLNGTGKSFTKSAFMESLTEGLWFTDDVLMTTLEKYNFATNEIYNRYLEYAEQVQTSDIIKEISGDIDEGLSGNSKQFSIAQAELMEFGLEAFRAAQEARTFEDAVKSVQEAAASKWSGIFKSVFGNYLEAKDLWTKLANDLWEIFVGPLDSMMWQFRAWHDLESGSNGRSDLVESFWRIWDAVKNATLMVKSFFKSISDPTETGSLRFLAKFTRGFKALSDAIAPAFDYVYYLFRELKWVMDYYNGIVDTYDFADDPIPEEFLASISTIAGAFGVVVDKIKGFKEAVSELFTDFKGIVGSAFERITDRFSSAFDLESFSNVLDALATAGTFIVQVLLVPFGLLASAIASVVEWIRTFADTYRASLGEDGVLNWQGDEKLLWLATAIDAVRTAISWFVDEIVSGYTAIKNFFLTISGKETDAAAYKSTIISTTLQVLGSALSNFWDTVKKIFSNLGPVAEWFVNNILIPVKDKVIESWDRLTTAVSRALSTMREQLDSLADDATLGERIRAFLDASKDVIKAALGEIDWDSISNILSFALGGLIVGTFEKLKKDLREAKTKLYTSLADFLDIVADGTERIAKQKSLENTAKVLESLTTSIVKMAASLFLISMIPADSLENSMNVLSELVIIVAGLTMILSHGKFGFYGPTVSNKVEGLKDGINQIFEAFRDAAKLTPMVSLVAVLTNALVKMAGVIAVFAIIDRIGNLDKAAVTLTAMIAVVTATVAFFYALSNAKGLDPSATDKFARVMNKFIGVIVAMTAVIVVLSLIPLHKLIAAGVTLSGMLLFMAIFIEALRGFGPFLTGAGTAMGKFSGLLLSIAGSMIIMSIAITGLLGAITSTIAFMKLNKDVATVAGAIGFIVAILAVFSAITVIAGRFAPDPKKLFGVVGAMAVMTIIVGSMVGLLSALSILDAIIGHESLWTAFGVVIATISGMALVLGALTLWTFKKSNILILSAVEKALLKMTVVVIAIGAVLGPLALLSGLVGVKKIWTAVGVVSAMFALMAVFLALVGKFGHLGGAINMTAAAQSISAMAGAMLKMAGALAIIALISGPFGGRLTKLFYDLGYGVIALLDGFFDAINASKDGIITGIFGVVSIIVAAWVACVDVLVDALLATVDTLLTALDEYLPSIGTHLVGIVLGILEILLNEENLNRFAKIMYDLGYYLGGSLGKAMMNGFNSDGMFDKIIAWWDSVVNRPETGTLSNDGLYTYDREAKGGAGWVKTEDYRATHSLYEGKVSEDGTMIYDNELGRWLTREEYYAKHGGNKPPAPQPRKQKKRFTTLIGDDGEISIGAGGALDDWYENKKEQPRTRTKQVYDKDGNYLYSVDQTSQTAADFAENTLSSIAETEKTAEVATTSILDLLTTSLPSISGALSSLGNIEPDVYNFTVNAGLGSGAITNWFDGFLESRNTSTLR